MTATNPNWKKTAWYKQLYKSYFFLQNQKELALNKLKKKITQTAVIVTYHRIANVTSDPRLLCVSPTVFDQHLQFFKKNFSVVSLPELITRIETRTLVGDELVITLDDGYEDNLQNALPLLRQYNLPATIFICTGQIGQTADFPWDREYSESDRAHFLSAEQIKQLTHEPLITTGAHTNTHPRLKDLSEIEQIEEIKKSRDILEQISGQKITLFAYPFGRLVDLNIKSPKVVERLGFSAACTMQEALVTKWSNLYKLPRINMRAYNASELADKLFYN